MSNLKDWLEQEAGRDLTPAFLSDFCQNLQQILGEGDPPAIRRLLASLDCEIRMSSRERGEVTVQFPPEIGGIVARATLGV
jgi:hypothetical protein